MKRAIANQRGMTLVEVLAALAIGAVLLLGLASLVENSLDDMKGQQAAYYQAQVVDAARRYLDKNAADVATATPAGTVLPITLKQLRDGKFLPESFADTNPYRQGTCVLVRRPDPANYPGQFDALIVTTGGDKIGDKDLPSVAMLAGSGGGYVATSAPGVARGASWRMPTDAFRGVACPGAVNAALRGPDHDGGQLVSSLFYDGAAQQAADFLYRIQIDGKPELNTMGAPVRFGGDGVVVAGTSCLVGANPTAGLAIDSATRAVLTCGTDGKWSLPGQWKAPVLDHPALLAVADPQIGDVRMVTALSRAFTFSGGEGWKPLAVDQDGNFDVPKKLTAETIEALVDIKSKGTIHSDGHISTEQDLHVKNMAYVERDVVADGVQAKGWMEAPAVHIVDTFAPGAACHYKEIDKYGNEVIAYPYGTIVTDDARRPLICGPDKTFRYSNGLYEIK
jgi:prepilin-type N-terminal cleavage/methylation domain-containing protein